MPRAKPRGRTERRASAREEEKLRRDLEQRARLSPGGAADRPIEIATPTLVDVRAAATPCPLCGGSLRLLEHAAETFHGARLRVARMTCDVCGVKRSFYFRLEAAPEE